MPRGGGSSEPRQEMGERGGLNVNSIYLYFWNQQSLLDGRIFGYDNLVMTQKSQFGNVINGKIRNIF